MVTFTTLRSLGNKRKSMLRIRFCIDHALLSGDKWLAIIAKRWPTVFIPFKRLVRQLYSVAFCSLSIAKADAIPISNAKAAKPIITSIAAITSPAVFDGTIFP